MAMAELNFGIKECRKCEYFVKCSECSCKHLHEDLPNILRADWRRTIEKFAAKVKEVTGAAYLIDKVTQEFLEEL